MKFGRWLGVAALALMPAAASSAGLQFAAPAGNLPAQHLRNAVYDAVLPSGRIVTPFGESVVSGIRALGITLTPDGRFAIVSNADSRRPLARSGLDPQVSGGCSLAIIDTATMRVTDRISSAGEAYFAGLGALADPRLPARTLLFAAGGASDNVYVFDLDSAGHITPDLQHVIPLPPPLDGSPDAAGTGFVGTLVAARDGRRVYAVDRGDDRVTAIDTVTRTVSTTSRAVGFAPFGAAVAGDRLLVTNEGLMGYAFVADAPLVPPFATPAADPLRASSLSILGLGPDGDFAPGQAGADTPPALAMDIPPDGTLLVGGAHPTAIVVTPDAAYAYVAMTNVDRIATVRLAGGPAVAGGTELRLFDRGPYGTQPSALALSRDGNRLYVALTGLNAIAVLDARDPLHLHRLGLIPTGWCPTAVALSADDRQLYVVNTNGFNHDTHDAGSRGEPAPGTDATAVWSTLQKIDLASVGLMSTTLSTLRNTRAAGGSVPAYPPALRNVVVILQQNKTFDAMLGDLGYGPADPANLDFGESVTPNLHALARRYAVAGNLFADAVEPGGAHQSLAGGMATAYSQLAPAAAGRKASAGDDPENYPRSGYLYHNLARHGVSFRDYGDGLRVSGYDDGEAPDPNVDDPAYAGSDDRRAPTHGLGGRYESNAPAPAIFAGQVDLDYPGWNLRIRDERRAREFVRDYRARIDAHRQPRYTHIWLPAGLPATGPGLPPPAEQVADGDRALGTIVQYLSRLPAWKNTVIFVLPDDAQNSRDHVDPSRTYALVVSPFAKRHYVGMRHLSPASVLKTTEQILHVPPLSLGDLLATDMSDFFTPVADARPFAALDVPTQNGER